MFQEQQLIASMWLKDWKLFWEHFLNYRSLHPNGSIPRHYQEAVLLCCYENDWNDMNLNFIDQQVKSSFEAFASQLAQYDGMEFEEARKALAPNFSNTYFFDYYLMRYDDVI